MSAGGRQIMPPWMRDIVRPFRRNAMYAIALGLVASGFSALLMFVSGYLISKTAQPGTTLFMVMAAVAFVQVFGIGRPLARYLERLISHDWVFRVTSSLRLKLFKTFSEHVEKPGEDFATGEQLELLSDDIGHLQNLYLRTAFPIVIALALYVLSGLFCGFFTLGLALALFGFGALSAVILPILAYAVGRPLQQRAKRLRSSEYARLADDVIGATDWALSGRSGEVRAAHEKACAETSAAAASTRRIVRVTECVCATLLSIGAVTLAAIATSSFQSDSESLNYIAAFALGVFPLIEAFVLLPQAFVGSIEHESAVDRLDALFKASPSRSDTPFAQPSGLDGTAVFVNDVSFSYPNAPHPALDHLSLAIPAGQRLAILGKSGSGKSTLAALMRGAFQPDCGNVFVNGHAADEPGESDVAYISQSPYIFDRTLRENLAIADDSATDARLTDALAKVGLSDKLESLAQGLDTPIGETGTGFSGGEAHRLALARALIARSPVVLLDEPFAAVDPATERQLLDTLFDAFEGKTLIVITHHLAQIERFDRVVFIEDGTVKLDGSPRDLMRDEPSFVQLLEFDRPKL